MSQTTLIPCPFAHIDEDGEPIKSVLKRKGIGFFVECNYCLARGPWAESKEMAAEFWNARVSAGAAWGKVATNG